ncbi:MAG TPA: GNAT family N-acetyltransferase [Clostridia bacterium]|nr:GNAT family N-acetyltransferase [Clostridia bacterium]
MNVEYDDLSDGEIDIVLYEKYPGDSTKGFVPVFKFSILLNKTGEKIGYINLRLKDTEKIVRYIGHIGYGINEAFRGNKFASKACNLVKKVANDLGMEKLVITCNPDNYASKRTCEIIGAKLIEIVDIPETSDAFSVDEQKKCRYEWVIRNTY